MLIQIIISPWATLWILPPVVSLSCLLLSGSIAGLSLGLKYVRAYVIGIPEISISSCSTVILGICVLLLLYINLINRWEDNFDSLPWKKQQSAAKAGLSCPFTGR
jgi:hypothetical protein